MKQLFVFILTAYFSAFGFAQEFKASVDRMSVGQNQRFEIEFTFSGGDINDVKNFKAPDFKGFKILSGPNRSSSVQIINGRMNSSLVISYILQGPELGNFIINSASITYGSKTYNSNSLSINVVTPSKNQTAAPNIAAGGVTDEEIAENLFLVAIPSKSSAVIGEEIILTYKLYTRLNISSPQIEKLPNYQGFWTEDLEMPKTLTFNYEMYKGVRFKTLELRKVALFPNQSGEIKIEPLELKVPVIIKKKSGSRDIFDEFFNDSFFGVTETVQYVAKASPITLNVRDFPKQGKPSSFKGISGEYELKSEMSKTEAEINESISLKFTLSGKGNIKLLDLPELPLPSGFEKYDPKYSENISRNNSITGTKVIEYLLVPRIPGKRVIKPMEFSYFNPKTGKYVVLITPEYTLDIKAGANGNYDMPAAGYSKEDVVLLNQDIRFIKTSGFNFQQRGEFKTVKNWFWAGLFFPLIALVAVVGYFRRKDKLQGNMSLMKYHKAEKVSLSRLKNAKKYLTEYKLSEFYAELSQALFGYLEDKLSIKKAEFTLEKAIEKLRDENVSYELISDLRQISEKCEFARFAPKADGSAEANILYEKCLKMIALLENSIIKKKL